MQGRAGYYEQRVKTDQQSVFEREWDGGRSHASLVLLLQRLERKQKIEGSKKWAECRENIHHWRSDKTPNVSN